MQLIDSLFRRVQEPVGASNVVRRVVLTFVAKRLD
jgi:hypothetical protein